MNDYIKREDAENIMLGSCDESALWKLRYLPPANVVEVVRCKDCKKYMTIHCTCDGCCISDEWYCADGERKEQKHESKTVGRRETTITEGYADDGGLMPAT